MAAAAGSLQTEFDFELPRGLVLADGERITTGKMRLATARDELLPLVDERVRTNPAYLTVLLLSRVITQLGPLEEIDINTGVIERLFATDLAFLQDLYRRINTEGTTKAEVTCPSCDTHFTVDLAGDRPGGA